MYDKCDVYESSDDVEYDVNENECVFEGFDERMSWWKQWLYWVNMEKWDECVKLFSCDWCGIHQLFVCVLMFLICILR